MDRGLTLVSAPAPLSVHGRAATTAPHLTEGVDDAFSMAVVRSRRREVFFRPRSSPPCRLFDLHALERYAKQAQLGRRNALIYLATAATSTPTPCNSAAIL